MCPTAESGSESDSDDEVGAQAPPLTKQISNILNRYPEGGQILKVTTVYCCVAGMIPLKSANLSNNPILSSVNITQFTVLVGAFPSVGVSDC